MSREEELPYFLHLLIVPPSTDGGVEGPRHRLDPEHGLPHPEPSGIQRPFPASAPSVEAQRAAPHPPRSPGHAGILGSREWTPAKALGRPVQLHEPAGRSLISGEGRGGEGPATAERSRRGGSPPSGGGGQSGPCCGSAEPRKVNPPPPGPLLLPSRGPVHLRAGLHRSSHAGRILLRIRVSV